MDVRQKRKEGELNKDDKISIADVFYEALETRSWAPFTFPCTHGEILQIQ